MQHISENARFFRKTIYVTDQGKYDSDVDRRKVHTQKHDANYPIPNLISNIRPSDRHAKYHVRQAKTQESHDNQTQHEQNVPTLVNPHDGPPFG